MTMRRNGLTHGRTIRKERMRRNSTDRYGRLRRNETARTTTRSNCLLAKWIDDEVAFADKGAL